jgi:winged helix DNA-binding protein
LPIAAAARSVRLLPPRPRDEGAPGRAEALQRVYRPQGWISPVVLRGASIIGVWFPTTSGKTTTLRVELFGRVTPAIGEALVREAEAMGRFLGGRCAVRFGTV